MFIVLRLSGNSEGRADYVRVNKFSTVEAAKEFVINNTYPAKKYWSVASIIEANGEEYETYQDSLL